MRILWLGCNDDKGCVLHWHRLRETLRDVHGVELIGPGYSWPVGEVRALSFLLHTHGTPDIFVVDDQNAIGYVPVVADCRPDCLVAWREHDYHNRTRQQSIAPLAPSIILGTVERTANSCPSDPYRDHPGWHLVPHSVDFKLFREPRRPAKYAIGLYGKTGACYRKRTAARQALMWRPDAWLPVHGGYWKDGRGSCPGKTFYNAELGNALADCAMLWVDGSDYRVAVLKYFEGAAAGCCLVGEKPYGWEHLFPDGCMIDAAPEALVDLVGYYIGYPKEAEDVAMAARTHLARHHTIERRAEQIMEILGGAL